MVVVVAGALAIAVGCSGSAAPRTTVGEPEAEPDAPAPASEPPEGPASSSAWTIGEPLGWTSAPIRNAAATPPRGPTPSKRLVELRPAGLVNEIGVAPGGALWITTDDGDAFRSDGFDHPWRRGALDCTGADGRRARCSRVTFFTDQIAVATGYVGAGQDEYFRTESAGRSWERLTFGRPGVHDGQWIYDVFVGEGGEAWMGGSHGRLLHTPDSGRTWSLRASPFDHGSRLHRLFFDGEDGIAGALRNEMKVSRDAGRTWEPIDTPLDQRAQSGAVADPDGDDRIENVALFGDFMLAEQDGRVFVSPRRPVRWTHLAGGTFTSFAIDRRGRGLFAITERREVAVFDRQLVATMIRGARLPAPHVDMHVEGAVLYALDEAYGLHRIDASGARFTALMTDGEGPQRIDVVRRAGDRLWGISPHGLYASDDGGARWDLRHTTERNWIGLAARGADDLLIWDDQGAVEHWDARSGRARPVASLAGARVHAMTMRGERWLALGGDASHGAAWISEDGGDTWAPLDRWTGAPARDAWLAADGTAYLWTRDNLLRVVPHGAGAASPPASTPAPAQAVELPTSTTLYFADARRGWVGGYIHHGGDAAWETRNGGGAWSPVERDTYPFLMVVPWRTGALAVAGHSFSYEDDNRRDVWLLEGSARRLAFRAPEQITDLSVDPDGRVLIELDPAPESYDDTTGRHWLEIRPH